MRTPLHFLLLASACASASSAEQEDTLPPRTAVQSVPSASSDDVEAQREAFRRPCWPGWEAGETVAVRTEVELRRHEVQGQLERDSDYRVEGDIRLEVERRGDAWVVRRDFSGWRGEKAIPATFASYYVRHAIPTLLLRSDGQLIAIEGEEEARQRATEAISERAGVPAGSEDTWRSIISDRGLRNLADEWWTAMTHLSCTRLPESGGLVWTGSVHAGGTEVPGHHRVREVGPVQCGERTCERRVLETRADSEALCAEMAARAPFRAEFVECGWAYRADAMRDVETQRVRVVRVHRTFTTELVLQGLTVRNEVTSVTTYDLRYEPAGEPTAAQ